MYTETLFRAIAVAVRAHSGQFRKGTTLPYIYHPLEVGRMLIEIGCEEDLVVAGILHDTVEDTNVTLEEIRAGFGDTVSGIVKLLTHNESNSTWEERKTKTLEDLQTASQNVLLVACADKLDNIRAIRKDYETLGETFWTRFRKGKSSQQWYYQKLALLFLERIHDKRGLAFANELYEQVKHVFGQS